MSRRLGRQLLLGTLACAAGIAGAATEGLRHDPFARPRSGLAVPQPGSGALAANAGATASATLAAAPWQPELRGVMLAGAASMANVAGNVVAVGETIDGWRLVRVEDGKAFFVKGGQRTTLNMLNAGQPRP